MPPQKAKSALAAKYGADLDKAIRQHANDATDYGPFRSFQLFVAVVIGGAASALGPAVGIAALALVSAGGAALAELEGIQSVRFEPMFTALLLLTILGLGGIGFVPALRRALTRGRERPQPRPGTNPPLRAVAGSARLEATALQKRFESVVAVRTKGIDLRNRERILELLTIQPEPGAVLLVFADNVTLRLEIEELSCFLEDLGDSWPTRWRPCHPDDVADADRR